MDVNIEHASSENALRTCLRVTACHANLEVIIANKQASRLFIFEPGHRGGLWRQAVAMPPSKYMGYQTDLWSTLADWWSNLTLGRCLSVQRQVTTFWCVLVIRHWDDYVSLAVNCLAHWGRVTHICVSKLNIIGSDNGLSPDRRQAIIWTNAGLLLIGPLGTNFSEIFIEILTFSFKKIRLKVSSAKRRPFCLGLNVLNHEVIDAWYMPYIFGRFNKVQCKIPSWLLRHGLVITCYSFTWM